MAEVKQATLAGRKLFIGIPAYDGKLNIKTAYGLAQLMPEAMRLGVAVTLSDISNCSLITLARNARTSVEVINNHYASTVTGEQNIAMLQSKRGNVLRS